jgi:hypothetical protein
MERVIQRKNLQAITDGLRIEEATLDSQTQSVVDDPMDDPTRVVADPARVAEDATRADQPTRTVANEPTRRIPVTRETELIRAARRHPATIALIQEITAQVQANVEAAADRKLELAKADLRHGVVFHHGLFQRMDLVTLGAFTTVNLLLVTLAFALSHVMAPWLAGLLVAGISLAGTATVVFRSSNEPGQRLPALRRFTVRRFARRLFAGT